MRETKLSQNPNYGKPSARKVNSRLDGWRNWARGMAMLRSIHEEIKDKLAQKAQADNVLQNAGAWQQS